MALGDGEPKESLRGMVTGENGDDAAGGSLQTSPPQLTRRLWIEVATGIDKKQTVVWKNAVDSLREGLDYLLTSVEARRFVVKYMRPVVSILLDQQHSKIGQMEKGCVEESLRLAVMIIATDLKAKADVACGNCELLEVLSMVFSKKKTFYRGSKSSWNSHATGLPEVRVQLINKFRSLKGFSYLATYLSGRVSSSNFPPLEQLHFILHATADSILHTHTVEHTPKVRGWEDDAIRVAKSVMNTIDGFGEDALKRQMHEVLNQSLTDVHGIFSRLDPIRRRELNEFFKFWRSMVLKLISSQSLPLKLFGWEQMNAVIYESRVMRPPPRAFIASGAGCQFANGIYEFNGAMTEGGYVKPGGTISYQLQIPPSVTEKDGGGKRLTLFQCTMRSQQKWWFLSEADEDQPGTDKDVDYYQHKSNKKEEAMPPMSGWVTCRSAGSSAGTEPPPTLESSGVMVPRGEEYNTLEHQLAKWAIQNHLIELVLGDSVHREVVARSKELIEFLGSMCTRDQPLDGDHDLVSCMVPNCYCLLVSHLLLAWKTCTSKADAAVSAEVYKLLVEILPTLPNNLAITLLKEIQKSLADRGNKRDYLFEVAEFCSALAFENNKNSNDADVPVMSDDVRSETLELLWNVLTHPDASSLKNYDQLKNYVTNELRIEPMGTKHREKFLRSCCQSLKTHANLSVAGSGGDAVDEFLALRMVKLTRFILEACPREQAAMMVTADNAALAVLLFRELIAHLERRASALSPSLRKLPSGSVGENNNAAALSERLHIIRYAYGITDRADMTSQQLDHLWVLCAGPEDREALMIFLAKASTADNDGLQLGDSALDNSAPVHQPRGLPPTASVTQVKQPLSAAYSSSLSLYAFQNLFCASNIDWEKLGEGAYQSFQTLFKSLSKSERTSLTSNGPALDALWRICLSGGNDDVVSQAMRDLLSVYGAMAQQQSVWNQTMETSDPTSPEGNGEEKFAGRVFQCLVNVKEGLKAGDPTSERSAERCMRILNAAVGHSDGGGGKTSTTAISATLEALSTSSGLADVFLSVPHGMRGQSSYRSIGVMAKRTPSQSHSVTNSGTVPSLSSSGSQIVPTRLPSSLRFSLNVHPLETLASLKAKVAKYCNHPAGLVKPLTVSGRHNSYNARTSGDSGQSSLNNEAEGAVMSQLGIVEGCEVVFLLANQPLQSHPSSPSANLTFKKGPGLDLSEIFIGDGSMGSADRFFDILLDVLEALPVFDAGESDGLNVQSIDTHKLVWDLLLSMPSNCGIIDRVRSLAEQVSSIGEARDGEAITVETPRRDVEWSILLDSRCFHRSVYVMQVIDSFLQPAPELLSVLAKEKSMSLQTNMRDDAISFRQGFIESGGFDAVMKFFTSSGSGGRKRRQKTQIGNVVSLRILKCCFYGNAAPVDKISPSMSLDNAGQTLLMGLSDSRGLLTSLTLAVVADEGVTDGATFDVLQLLQLLFTSVPRIVTEIFASLPNDMAEKFLMVLLIWESKGTVTAATVNAGSRIRKCAEDLILLIPELSQCALPWLIKAMDQVDVSSDATDEFFSVLRKLVEDHGQIDPVGRRFPPPTASQLRDLGTAVCKKLASHPRPTSDNIMIDFSTGVLCGCLRLLRALIDSGGGMALIVGVALLSKAAKSPMWSQMAKDKSSIISSMFSPRSEDKALINLMGVMFDEFLSSGETSLSASICCDKDSRQLGFEVVAAAARTCRGGDGYLALVERINSILASAAPSLRHRWGQNVVNDDRGSNQSLSSVSKYSGLRNQGCTCYMNSVLQQLFMMPRLRENLCSASLPTSVRSSGSATMANGADLVGKKISLHWDSGVSYDASVEAYDKNTGTHTVCYLPLQIATVNGPQMAHHQTPQIQPEDLVCLPDELPDEFFLHEGRPGKETGTFEIISTDGMDVSSEDGNDGAAGESSGEGYLPVTSTSGGIKETEDEASSRRLLEEVQRTFVHLDEGSRGRCFDPRSLVEASSCLKLEFDVWQQNDASEFAMKLLDRLEVSLKRWSPNHFKYLEHTFGIKQTKQKICKACGLKTNREEHLMNIDCQIRGKTDVYEALDTMCEVEFMEGDNKVFCDRCKKKTDTVLRTAISALPDVLVLSLKRFDLDYNTFETVKLNSRCAFGQTLNMKKYTLEGVEAMEKGGTDEQNSESDSMMETEERESSDPLSDLSDEDYEYKLAGVLVHAGVAQGGHYYSFIKDRSSPNGEGADKWFRFDDEDVTPFDPSSIEVECFGGKVKKETKFPNGQVHIVESEQFANALMLFYEKVKPEKYKDIESDQKEGGIENAPMDEKEQDAENSQNVEKSSGYDIFQPDVRRSNKIHSWQTFLFDTEFQYFSRGLLDLCLLPSCSVEAEEIDSPALMSSPIRTSPSIAESDEPWRMDILVLSISYFFDILLHSVDKDVLKAWTAKLLAALNQNRTGAISFTHDLAKKTRRVGDNWLRVYCSDCPEEASRDAAIQVMAAGIKTCAASTIEKSALELWTKAWRLQVDAREKDLLSVNRRQQLSSMPLAIKLEGKSQSREDVTDLDKGSASSLGIIISFLTNLLEVAPRTWRYNADLCLLISELASLNTESGGQYLRNAMVAAQIPARLVCIITKERSPFYLRSAFPGASVSHEIAEAMLKAETTPSSHLLPLAGGAVGTSVNAVGGNASIPGPSDFIHLLEALGCTIGVHCVRRVPLISETGDFSKGRALLDLSHETKTALTIIFNESMTASACGMSQNDILKYMRLCGVDANTVPPKKVANILAKYATTGGIDAGKEARFLTLDGFLDYYRDTAQSDDAQQVFSDLNAFGFRPDLTRRADTDRFYAARDVQRTYQSSESIALDVTSTQKDKKVVRLGKLTEIGLLSFGLYSFAYSVNEVLSEYILASFSHGRDTTKVIVDALKNFNRAQSGWPGNELVSACNMVFRIQAAITDERQQERITALMQSTEKIHSHSDMGVGLLVASKEVLTMLSRHSQQFTQGNFERYVSAVKDLHKQREVKKWMADHHSLWSWMETDQFLNPDVVSADYMGRRDGVHPPSVPLNHHHHSDSDMNASEDDDSRFEQDSALDVGRVIVQNAGVKVVNGVYTRDGTFDNVAKYCKIGMWNNEDITFSLFRCKLSDETRRWYISIVPKNIQPGTNKDVDFYSAPMENEHYDTPPENSWSTAKGEGIDPPPMVINADHAPNSDEDQGDGGGRWNNDADNTMEEEGDEPLGYL